MNLRKASLAANVDVDQAFATLEAGGGVAYVVLELRCKAGEVDLREEAISPYLLSAAEAEHTDE